MERSIKLRRADWQSNHEFTRLSWLARLIKPLPRRIVIIRTRFRTLRHKNRTLLVTLSNSLNIKPIRSHSRKMKLHRTL